MRDEVCLDPSGLILISAHSQRLKTHFQKPSFSQELHAEQQFISERNAYGIFKSS